MRARAMERPVQGALGRSSNAISVEQFETHHDAATATAIATGASNGPNCAEGSLPSAQPASTPLMTTVAAPHLAGASAGMQRWPGAPVGVYSYSASMMAPQSLVASPANFSGMTVDADSVPGYQQSAPSSSWAEASAYDVTASGRSWSGLALSAARQRVPIPVTRGQPSPALPAAAAAGRYTALRVFWATQPSPPHASRRREGYCSSGGDSRVGGLVVGGHGHAPRTRVVPSYPSTPRTRLVAINRVAFRDGR